MTTSSVRHRDQGGAVRATSNGIFPYPRRTAPFGFNGGSYYVRLGMTF